MTVLKVVGLNDIGDREANGAGKRNGSKYPLSDQIIDVAVMAGVYAVLAVLEVGLEVWRAERRVPDQGVERTGMTGSAERVMGETGTWDAAGK